MLTVKSLLSFIVALSVLALALCSQIPSSEQIFEHSQEMLGIDTELNQWQVSLNNNWDVGTQSPAEIPMI